MTKKQSLTLKEYISQYYGSGIGSQVAYAKAMGVNRQQVTKWVNAGFHVNIDENNHTLMSPRRSVPVVKKVFNAFGERLERLTEYPLFKMRVSGKGTYSAFITLDIDTGAIDAAYIEQPSRVCDNLLLFPVGVVIPKVAIHTFIEDNLSAFQYTLATHGGDNSGSIDEMAHIVRCKLPEDGSGVITPLTRINFKQCILSEPPKSKEELRERVESYVLGKILLGINVEQIERLALDELKMRVEMGFVNSTEAGLIDGL